MSGTSVTSSLTQRAAAEGVAANEVWRLPFSLPSFQEGIGSLRASVVEGWRRWAEQAVLIAELAGRVPREPDEWAWKSFLREVAVARRCSDQAAAKEVFLAVALVHSHPRTLELVKAGLMPQYHAVVLIEETAGCSPAVRTLVEDELAEKACRLTPARIRAEVRKLELRWDPDGAAARSAEATRQRNVQVHGGKDDQASLVISGPALPIVRFYESVTKAARAARAAGDPRGLDALRFDLAVDVTTPTETTSEPAEPTGASTAEPTAVPVAEPAEPAEPTCAPTAERTVEPTVEPVAEPAVAPVGSGVEVRPVWLGDRRRVRPMQVLLHLPVTTALGLDNEPGWLPGYGWVSAPQCRQWLTTAELRQVCVDRDGTVVDLADRAVRPDPTPQGVREAVLAMVADPGPITTKTWRTEPRHDPSPPLRDFIDVRDLYCDGPTGTQVPASRCHRDHNERWPDGPTAAWNLKARADRTHQLKHRGWIPLRLPDSTMWFSPAGQVVQVDNYTDPPPPLHPNAHLPDPDELHHVDAGYLEEPGDPPLTEPPPAQPATGWDDDPPF